MFPRDKAAGDTGTTNSFPLRQNQPSNKKALALRRSQSQGHTGPCLLQTKASAREKPKNRIPTASGGSEISCPFQLIIFTSAGNLLQGFVNHISLWATTNFPVHTAVNTFNATNDGAVSRLPVPRAQARWSSRRCHAPRRVQPKPSQSPAKIDRQNNRVDGCWRGVDCGFWACL